MGSFALDLSLRIFSSGCAALDLRLKLLEALAWELILGNFSLPMLACQLQVEVSSVWIFSLGFLTLELHLGMSGSGVFRFAVLLGTFAWNFGVFSLRFFLALYH